MITARKKRKKRSLEQGGRAWLLNTSFWQRSAILVVLFLSNVATVGGQDVIRTSYSSGALCGSNPPRRCLSQAHCSKDGVCQCPNGTIGDGSFHCSSPNTLHAQISGIPPTLTSFHNTTAAIYWPCRFLITELSIVRKAEENEGETCNFQIFVTNQILGGSIRMTSVDVHIRRRKGNTVVSAIGVRKKGIYRNNTYEFVTEGRIEDDEESQETDEDEDYPQDLTDGSGSGDGVDIDDEDSDDEDEWGQPEELNTGDDEKADYDVDQDNFSKIIFPKWGIDIRFKPSSPYATDQDQLPGVSIDVSKDIGEVIVHRPDHSLAETSELATLANSARTKNIRTEQEILDRVMKYSVKQNRPSTQASFECEDTPRVYKSYCRTDSQKWAALRVCSFFLENLDLVSCLDPPSETAAGNSLNVFKLCVWTSCQPSNNVCSLLRSIIRKKGCTSFLPQRFFEILCGK